MTFKRRNFFKLLLAAPMALTAKVNGRSDMPVTIMREVLKNPQYVAVSQEGWHRVWNGLQPAHRILERESPLGALGHISVLHPEHGVLVVIAKDRHSKELTSDMGDSVRKLGLDIRIAVVSSDTGELVDANYSSDPLSDWMRLL